LGLLESATDDPDLAKSDQYVRWRGLRKLEEENEKKVKGADRGTRLTGFEIRWDHSRRGVFTRNCVSPIRHSTRRVADPFRLFFAVVKITGTRRIGGIL
jgi:hypothetical protein